MEYIKTKIEKIVKKYIEEFSEEFELVKRQISKERAKQRTKFAETKTYGFLERKLVEVPESLFNIFMKELGKDEIDYYLSKEGTRWFAQKYPFFRVAEKI